MLQEEGLFDALKRAGQQGMPMFGTCAGAILLAKEVLSPSQPSLGLADVSITRNAYGRQLASRITQGQFVPENSTLEMVFIRAPQFVELGSGVKTIATYQNQPVCVQDRQFLLATFHPELTHSTQLHEYFLTLIDKHSSVRQNKDPV
ncbi:MAG: pyridoxal 5'-phosphate synthase glutaminase subunit PdxT [Gammaproteobacteria bacterium]